MAGTSSRWTREASKRHSGQGFSSTHAQSERSGAAGPGSCIGSSATARPYATWSRPESDPDADTRRLSATALTEGDATGWFEELYTEARNGAATVPWDLGRPSSRLVEWLEANALAGAGRSALVIGCGPGRGGFDFVLEGDSVPALPATIRRAAIAAVSPLVASG